MQTYGYVVVRNAHATRTCQWKAAYWVTATNTPFRWNSMKIRVVVFNNFLFEMIALIGNLHDDIM